MNKIPKQGCASEPCERRPETSMESWRLFEIMAEFVQGTENLARIQPAVTIFGSARVLPSSPDYALTEALARALSDAGFSVISGGGPGIMEAANKGAYAGKSPSVGLNIQLPHEQHINPYQDVSQTFRHFFARKVMFVRHTSAFVIMPGGYGTLDELMEVLTLVQTHKIRRVPIILMQRDFWQGLLDWLRADLVGRGMIAPEDLDLVQVMDDPQAVVDAIFRHYEHQGFAPTTREQEILLNL